MLVRLELREQGTNLYGDDFDECRGINLEIWNQWLYHGTDDDKVRVGSDSGVYSYGDSGIATIKLVNKIKLNVSNVMYRNYLNYHISVW